MSTSQQYIYRITEVVKVTDGDTFWLRLDVGFRQTLLVNLRLSGYDCPERTRGSERERAMAREAQQVAALFLQERVVRGAGSLWVRTEQDPDNFGRWLGDVWREDPDGIRRHLGAELRSHDLASVWPRRWRDEFDTTT